MYVGIEFEGWGCLRVKVRKGCWGIEERVENGGGREDWEFKLGVGVEI